MSDSEFSKWVQQWDDAQSKGIFKDDTPQLPDLNKQSSDNSYFGMCNSHSTDDIPTNDSEYWRQVLAASDPEFKEEMLNENNKKLGDMAKAIAQSPNPVRPHSLGKDQDLTPQSLGLTYSEQDVEELAGLKLQLHALQDKLNTFECRGQNGKKFESQIQSLQKKIDELSTAMTQAFPNALGQQGD
jgi:hypothetical protein